MLTQRAFTNLTNALICRLFYWDLCISSNIITAITLRANRSFHICMGYRGKLLTACIWKFLKSGISPWLVIAPDQRNIASPPELMDDRLS